MSCHNSKGTQRLNKTVPQLSLLTVPFNGSKYQVFASLCQVSLPFLSRDGLFLLLTLGFSSANKLSLLLFSVFVSSAATLSSKALPLSVVYLHFMSPAFLQSLYNCCCWAINIKSYSSLEYLFKLIFPMKRAWSALVSCLLEDLVSATEATFTLGAGAPLSMYCVWNVTTASKSFSYCLGAPILQ